MQDNQKTKILIISEKLEQIDILREAVWKLGYLTIAASGAEKAKNLLAGQNKADLLLIDLEKSSFSYLDLIKNIRSEDSELPIIILTSYGSQELATQAIGEGANDFLTKPIATSRLGLSISNLLRMRNLHRTINQLENKLIAGGVIAGTIETPVLVSPSAVDKSGKIKKLEEIEQDAIRFALASSGNSMSKAARMLGIGRSTLYRKVEASNPRA